MEFTVTEKHECIYVKMYSPEPWLPQTFYPLIDRINEQIKNLYIQKKHSVVFDFLDLSFIDSYMISMLVQTLRLTEPQRNVILVSDNQVYAIITLIGIDKIYHLYSTKEEWLNKKDLIE